MDFLLPELGEGVYEAELVRWLVKPRDAVKRGQPLMEVMTDKATMEVPAPFAGIVGDLRVKPGVPLKVGDVVLTYQGGNEPTASSPKKPRSRGTPAPIAPLGKDENEVKKEMHSSAGPNGPALPAKAAPSVRQMARKLGIDINRIQGSGPQGRILIEDLSTSLAPIPDQGAAMSSPVKTIAKPDYGTPGTQIKLQGLRRIIAERMVQSKNTIPHYTYVDECDVSEMVRLREGLREAALKIGAKVTYLAFFVKAAAAALREVPLVNSSLDEAAGEILLHDHCHIGIAVAAPAGLMVPVIRDADKKDLFQIAREIERLTNEARTGKAKREDLIGATFTVTSIGSIGGLFATPVINPPEVGILGIGRVVKRPVFDAAGDVKPADMIYLSFSFDHRIVDGAVGAAFGNAIIKQVRNPAALLIV